MSATPEFINTVATAITQAEAAIYQYDKWDRGEGPGSLDKLDEAITNLSNAIQDIREVIDSAERGA
jgi:hypothetical protein